MNNKGCGKPQPKDIQHMNTNFRKMSNTMIQNQIKNISDEMFQLNRKYNGSRFNRKDQEKMDDLLTEMQLAMDEKKKREDLVQEMQLRKLREDLQFGCNFVWFDKTSDEKYLMQKKNPSE